MTKSKSLIYIILVAGIILLSGCLRQPVADITSFDECVKAGYPVLESYPRQCKTVDDKIFREELDSMSTSTPTISQILETGPETVCLSDEDCWCRSFTGVNFIEGKSSSECCEEIDNFRCATINRCAKCFYR